ncbi:DUF4121 family protein [Bacteroides thetaiotaomicron]|uniref:DUF4121 family protein n=1 Tax=Bacteroides thetaiotaomicron TaxID=818 RepID=UPI002166A4F3|nr:DUF4121 family protein [Bacteroides thetaiotaomicron]MCS2850135.1 DUF4121 family protein [Bacteroides thetaiotaomicron]
MEFTDPYTVDSLQCFNGFHYRGYRINQSDTDKVKPSHCNNPARTGKEYRTGSR